MDDQSGKNVLWFLHVSFGCDVRFVQIGGGLFAHRVLSDTAIFCCITACHAADFVSQFPVDRNSFSEIEKQVWVMDGMKII